MWWVLPLSITVSITLKPSNNKNALQDAPQDPKVNQNLVE